MKNSGIKPPIVVSGDLRTKKQLNLDKKLIKPGIIILLAVVALLAIWLIDHKSSKAPVSKLSSAQTSQILSKQVVNSIKQRQYNQALENIQSQPDPNSETNLYLTAEIYMEANQKQNALAAYQKIEKMYGLDEGLAVTIASLAQNLKQNNTAKQYYQSAINILNKQPSTAQIQQQITAIKQDMQGL